MMKFLLIAVGLYLAVLTLFALLQTRMLFPTHLVPPASPLAPGAQRLVLDTPDGHRLRGVHIPPREPRADGRTLILAFGGNGWNAEAAAEVLHQIHRQADVVAFLHRGYAPSAGKPSAQAMLADAPLVHDSAVRRIRPDRTIAVGFSIGSGVAAELVGKRPIDGAILVTPFDTLEAVASDLYPWLPVGLLFQHEMNPAASLAEQAQPIALIVAGRDDIIPAERSEGLRRAVPNLVLHRTIAGVGHNDIYTHDEFAGAMREAFSAVTQR